MWNDKCVNIYYEPLTGSSIFALPVRFVWFWFSHILCFSFTFGACNFSSPHCEEWNVFGSGWKLAVICRTCCSGICRLLSALWRLTLSDYCDSVCVSCPLPLSVPPTTQRSRVQRRLPSNGCVSGDTVVIVCSCSSMPRKHATIYGPFLLVCSGEREIPLWPKFDKAACRFSRAGCRLPKGIKTTCCFVGLRKANNFYCSRWWSR